jgi:hypothetical protein
MSGGPTNLTSRITYPREAVSGLKYLLSIDLDHDLAMLEWPFPEEEYPVTCFLDVQPYFELEPIGSSTVVVHRFGGSYGPARFWLKPGQPRKAVIRVVLANSAGVPISVQTLDDIRIIAREQQRVTSVSTQERPSQLTPRVASVSEPDAFRWLHLPQLYFDASGRPQQDIAADLPRVLEGTTIHAVVTSGHLALGGKIEEYRAIQDYLDHLLETIGRSQRVQPWILAVPSSSDGRLAGIPNLTREVGRGLRDEAQLRSQFWSNPSAASRRAVEAAFRNYAAWWDLATADTSRSVVKRGLLPGDFSLDLHVGQLSVGIIGLNDALPRVLSRANHYELAEQQLRELCPDPWTWVESHDLRILMTRNNTNLFTPSARAIYPRIAPAWLFDVHLHNSRGANSPPLHVEAGRPIGVSSVNGGPSPKYRPPRASGYNICELSKNAGRAKVTVWTCKLGTRSSTPPRSLPPTAELTWDTPLPPEREPLTTVSIILGPGIEGTVAVIRLNEAADLPDKQITVKNGVASTVLPVGQYVARHVESGVTEEFNITRAPDLYEVVFPHESIEASSDGTFAPSHSYLETVAARAFSLNYDASVAASDKALIEYSRVVAMPLAPAEELAFAYYNRGVLRGEHGDTEGEFADYTKVIELDGAPMEQLSDALFNRAMIHGQVASFNIEVDDYSRLMALPGVPTETLSAALYNRALAKELLGDTAGEMADYADLINLQDAPVELRAMAYINRAQTHAAAGDWDEALSEYSAVLELPHAPPELVDMARRGVKSRPQKSKSSAARKRATKR